MCGDGVAKVEGVCSRGFVHLGRTREPLLWGTWHVQHAALSDQGSHQLYILHGVYYLKDRGAGQQCLPYLWGACAGHVGCSLLTIGIVSHNFMGLHHIRKKYYMEEDTREAKLPHDNVKVGRKAERLKG